MSRITSFGPELRQNSFPVYNRRQVSVATHKHVNQNLDLELEEENIGLEAVEPGLRWPDNSAKTRRISVQLDEDQIFQAATDYQRWTNGTYVFENLPRFDNATISDLTLEDENTMIKKEIAKLSDFASSEKPPIFNSNGILSTINPEGLKDLAKVLDQIKTHLEVIRHDNSLLILEKLPYYSFYKTFKDARDFIRERYQQDDHNGQIRISGREPKKLDDEANNTKVYHALVDFIFKCLAWWLMHVAKSDSWNTHIIAVMARWAVKLKFIALDPVLWVKKGLAKGEDVMRQLETEQKDEAMIQVQLLVEPEKEGQKIVFPDDLNLAKPYYESKSRFRVILLEMVHGVLENLNTGLLSSNSVEFSVRTLIYRSGLSQRLRQLAVRQNGNLSTTSGGRDFQYSHMAFQLLVSNSQSIVDCKPAAPNRANVCWHHVVNGEVSPVCRDRGKKRTDKIDDIISLLIPLSFMENSRMVEKFHAALAWTIAHEDPNSQKLDQPSEETLELEFSVNIPKRVRLPAIIDPDTIPSSQSPLFTGLEEEMKNLKDHWNFFHRPAAKELRRKALELFNAYKTGESEQKSWAICESSIRVKTTKYSTIVLTFAIVIILGSVCIPFLVGERIKGVDPFQIVTFAWLLAGAFLIGAKSRYVDEWPWHDFLRGQIICRSVSELAQASRLREQTILLYLLQNEFKKPLKFRGAFIGPFNSSESGNAAFNIDVALDHATVLAAGFIVLKVWDKNGWHLLLHDSRDGAAIYSKGYLVYKGFESNQVNSGKKKELREDQRDRGSEFLKLERDNLFDHKVLGQYVKDCQFG